MFLHLLEVSSVTQSFKVHVPLQLHLDLLQVGGEFGFDVLEALGGFLCDGLDIEACQVVVNQDLVVQMVDLLLILGNVINDVLYGIHYALGHVQPRIRHHECTYVCLLACKFLAQFLAV